MGPKKEKAAKAKAGAAATAPPPARETRARRPKAQKGEGGKKKAATKPSIATKAKDEPKKNVKEKKAPPTADAESDENDEADEVADAPSDRVVKPPKRKNRNVIEDDSDENGEEEFDDVVNPGRKKRKNPAPAPPVDAEDEDALANVDGANQGDEDVVADNVQEANNGAEAAQPNQPPNPAPTEAEEDDANPNRGLANFVLAEKKKDEALSAARAAYAEVNLPAWPADAQWTGQHYLGGGAFGQAYLYVLVDDAQTIHTPDRRQRLPRASALVGQYTALVRRLARPEAEDADGDQGHGELPSQSRG